MKAGDRSGQVKSWTLNVFKFKCTLKVQWQDMSSAQDFNTKSCALDGLGWVTLNLTHPRRSSGQEVRGQSQEENAKLILLGMKVIETLMRSRAYWLQYVLRRTDCAESAVFWNILLVQPLGLMPQPGFTYASSPAQTTLMSMNNFWLVQLQPVSQSL